MRHAASRPAHATQAAPTSPTATTTWPASRAPCSRTLGSINHQLPLLSTTTPASQRTQQVFTAGNYVNYTYDTCGQLLTAIGKESGGTTNRLHEQFGYAYDPAGNLNYRTNNALIQNL